MAEKAVDPNKIGQSGVGSLMSTVAAPTLGKVAGKISDTEKKIKNVGKTDDAFKPAMEKLADHGDIPKGVAYKDLSENQKSMVQDEHTKELKKTKMNEISEEIYGKKLALIKNDVNDPHSADKVRHVEEAFAKRQEDADAGKHGSNAAYKSADKLNEQHKEGVAVTKGFSGAVRQGLVHSKNGSWDPHNLPDVKNKFVSVPAQIIRGGMGAAMGLKFSGKVHGEDFLKDLQGIFAHHTSQLKSITGVDAAAGLAHGGGHGDSHGKDDHGKKDDKKGGAHH